ncbi:hypothetical protein D3C72_1771130 [compost metagenome]
MVRPHDGDHRRGLPVLHADALLRGAAVGDADVRIAMQHDAGDLGRRRHAHMELQARIALAEFGNDARQELDRKPRRAGHPHPAPAQALQRGNL